MAAEQCIAAAYFLSLVLAGVRYQEPKQGSGVAPAEVDYVVVGGGSAGAVLASRLAEVSRWQVLLLEAGPEEPTVQQVPTFISHTYSSSVYDWQLKVEGESNDHTGVISRAKMLGGCSAHNAMVYQRGTDADFSCWVNSGAKGWSYEEVLPFYKKPENNLNRDIAKNRKYHSVGGPLNIQRMPYEDINGKLLRAAYKEAGMGENDLNGGHDEGYGWTQTTSGYGQRSSSNTAFLLKARQRYRNLHVVTQAHVKKVNINRDTKVAESVQYVGYDGLTRIVRVRREVILSAGAFMSPQLLMVSGVGPVEQLKKAGIPVVVDLPTVGTNLQDHIISSYRTSIVLNETVVIPTAEDLQRDARLFAEGHGPLTTVGLATLVVRKRSPLQSPADNRPYMWVQHQSSWANGKSQLPICNNEKFSTQSYYNMIYLNAVLLHPQEAGEVRLNTSNPYGPPLIYQKIFSTDEDVRAFAAGLKDLTEILLASTDLRQAGARVVLPNNGAPCGDSAVGSQAWYECAVRTGGGRTWGHSAGTCSIGKVVDPRLRVLGVKGLRVADASVMPCVTSGNTNAPSMMVGERAAHFIKEENGIWW